MTELPWKIACILNDLHKMRSKMQQISTKIYLSNKMMTAILVTCADNEDNGVM